MTSLLKQVDNGLRNYYGHKNVPYDEDGVGKFCEWADENGYFSYFIFVFYSVIGFEYISFFCSDTIQIQ